MTARKKIFGVMMMQYFRPVLLGTATHVLHISRHAQGLILGRCQLLLKGVHARHQVITRCLSSIRLKGLRIQVLFVSHAFLL